MKILLSSILLFISAHLLANEPSAFGAGNLNSDKPYGLTETEKLIYDNRQKIKSIKSDNSLNSTQLQSLRERIDGLQSVVESISQKSQQNSRLVNQIHNSDENSTKVEAENFAQLVSQVNANEQNIKSIKSLLEEIALKLDGVYTTYVSKTQYNTLVKSVNEFKSEVSTAIDTGSPSKSVAPVKRDVVEKISNADLLKLANSNYKKLYFRKAIPQFEELIERNYKPAYSHYMIAQMWHYRKDWKRALSHYKVSASLNSKATYMPTLMLHSAESMINTQDEKNGKKFLKALISQYPDSDETQKAVDILNAMQ